MREIEGNLKKRYGKLAAQIWLGPRHRIMKDFCVQEPFVLFTTEHL